MATTDLIPSLTKLIPSLQKPVDWGNWHDYIRNYAININVWQYCNPASNDVVEREGDEPMLTPAGTPSGSPNTLHPTQPVFDQYISIRYTMWNNKRNERVSKEEKMGRVRQRIFDTVSHDYMHQLSEEQKATVRSILTALKVVAGQTNGLLEQNVQDEFNRLCTKKKNTPEEKWLSDWNTLVRSSELLEDSHLTERYFCKEFVKATYSSNYLFYSTEIVKMAEPEYLRNTRMSYLTTRYKQMSPLNHPNGGASRSAVFATVGHNRDDNGDNRNASTKQPTKDCICGEKHWYIDCPYLNAEKRTTGWKPVAERIKTVAEGLADVRIVSTINRSFKKRNKTPDLSWSTKTVEQQVQKTIIESTQPGSFAVTENPPPASFASAIFTVSDCKRSLSIKHSFILDTGANTHLCHDIRRFKSYKEAENQGTMLFGDTARDILGYGTIDIVISTERGLRTIELTNVAYLPGFHINLVAYCKLEAKGIFINGQQRQLHDAAGVVFADLTYCDGFYVIERSPLDRLQHPYFWTEKVFAFSTRSYRAHVSCASMDTWHRRLAHISPEALKKLEGSVDGAVLTTQQLEDRHNGDVCNECALTTANQHISRTPQWQGEGPFDKVHLDIIHMKEAYNGDEYIIHFYDLVTKMHFANCITGKHAKTLVLAIEEVLNLIRTWGFRTRYLHLDPDAALRDNTETLFKQLTRERGIMVERTPVRTKEPNGAAESSGKLITTRARALRIESGLPENLWPEFVKHAVHLLNRIPVKALNWKTPYEMVFRRKPSLASIRIIGSKTYVRRDFIGNQKAKKTADQSIVGFYIGSIASNIYRVWIPEIERVVDVRDVVVDEALKFDPKTAKVGDLPPSHSEMAMLEVEIPEYTITKVTSSSIPDLSIPENASQRDQSENTNNSSINPELMEKRGGEDNSASSLPTPSPTPETSIPPPPSTSHQSPTTSETPQTVPNQSENDGADQGQLEETPPATTIETDITQPVGDAPKKKRPYTRKVTETLVLGNLKKGTKSRPRHQAHLVYVESSKTLEPLYTAFASQLENRRHISQLKAPPKYWSDLAKHPDGAQFIKAAKVEVHTMFERSTWSRVVWSKIIKRRKPLPLKWVFTYKTDEDGYLIKHKARICVRGDLQEPDLADVYAATGAITTFRIMMGIVAAFDWLCYQMDAVNAFINAVLDQEVYVQWPDGFKEDEYALLLHRALYGLRISPKLWYSEVCDTLTGLNFIPCPDEQCLFIHKELDIYIFIYVDDFLLMSPRRLEEQVLEVKRQLKEKYRFKDMGEIKQFLQIRILREPSTIYLCQDAYFERLIERFNLEDAITKPVPMPLSSSFEQAHYEGEATDEQRTAYQQRVGCLIYPSIITRPDLAYAASKLSQFSTNPSPNHMREADRAIIYGYQTRYRAIRYQNTSNNHLSPPSDYRVASDASYGDVLPSRTSSQGFLISLFGGPISWQSSKQKSVTTSTTEAELMSATNVTKQVIAMMRLFNQMNFQIDETPSIACDNLQTVGIINKERPQLTTKLRHIDIHHFWLRQEVAEGRVSVHWVPTNEMAADGLTKALPREKHEEFLNLLGLIDITEKVIKLLH